MKSFNTFTPYLESCQKIQNFYILALEGDINKWYSDSYWFRGTDYEYQGFSDRKLESAKHVDATIWTMDTLTWMISKKSIYRNTTGLKLKNG